MFTRLSLRLRSVRSLALRGAGPLSSRTRQLHLNISEEVRAAVNDGRPVVALESTIITHGLPYPVNLEMAKSVEAVVRAEGAIPATTAIVDGIPRVGLLLPELESLAAAKNVMKVSHRDIAPCIAGKLSGGTTVATTLMLANKAGIKVFATGGLGGVHRGVSETWDVSADLEELARIGMAVVCSGPKSVLDIPKTLEVLETKGVYVATLGNQGCNLPGFWTRDSGVKSPYSVANAKEAAAILNAGTEFGLESGYVFCVPVPKNLALAPELVDSAVAFALADAEAEKITGKNLTPYLLEKVRQLTAGRSVATNVEFVKNNARFAAKMACHLSGAPEADTPGFEDELSVLPSLDPNSQCDRKPLDAFPPVSHGTFTGPPGKLYSQDHDSSQTDNGLESEDELFQSYGKPSSSRPSGMYHGISSIEIPPEITPQEPSSETLSEPKSTRASVAVVGALAQDISCQLNTDVVSCSSYPGRITTHLGGVGHNVALAAAYCGAKTRLISEVGDREKEAILGALSPAIDASGVKVTPRRSARYVAINDSKGELIVACSDMENVARMDPQYIADQLKSTGPEVVVFDGNIGHSQIEAVLESPGSFKIFEPTSIPKAARLADHKLRVFPHASVDMATPNSMELMSMFEEFSYKEHFNVDNWFPIIDSIPMDLPVTQLKLRAFIDRAPKELDNIVQSGLVQAAIHLLPYIPNLFVKLSSRGVISFQLIDNLRDRTADLHGANSLYIVNSGKPGVLVQHFPVPETILQENIRSVNGIGDTFCGALAADLARSFVWLPDSGELKYETVMRAQKAAALSLQTNEAVSREISDLFNE